MIEIRLAPGVKKPLTGLTEEWVEVEELAPQHKLMVRFCELEVREIVPESGAGPIKIGGVILPEINEIEAYLIANDIRGGHAKEKAALYHEFLCGDEATDRDRRSWKAAALKFAK